MPIDFSEWGIGSFSFEGMSNAFTNVFDSSYITSMKETISKNRPQVSDKSKIVGLLATVLIIIIIAVIISFTKLNSTVTYMGKSIPNTSISSLQYMDISYDSNGKIEYIPPVIYKQDNSGNFIYDASGNLTIGSYNDPTGLLGLYDIKDYYIYGSYNTCNLSGTNTNNTMSLEALNYVISQGVRFLDFEIYNVNEQPVVATSTIPDNYYIKESNISVPFNQVMSTIINKAFSAGTAPNINDPIFLHLRIKSTNQTMINNIASIFDQYEDLYLLGPEYSFEYQVCNAQICQSKNLSNCPLYYFQRKIIVMVDRSNSSVLDNSNLMEFVNITTDSTNCRLITNYEMVHSPDQQELLTFNKLSMTIVTPDVGVKPTNPDPLSACQLGIQINATDFSNRDVNNIANMNLFNSAGNAFILKPIDQRENPFMYSIPADNPSDYSFATRTNTAGRGTFTFNI